MKKIPAYTFVEILVALTITSLIIVLATGLYMQLAASNKRILKDYEKNQEILQLKSVLNMDFEKYNHIRYGIYELEFKDKNGICKYEFSSDGIIRSYHENKDTFRVEYSDVDYKLQNGNSGMVTHLSFNIIWHQSVLPFSFFKEYQSEEKVNQNIFR